jgi:hypothetical protein
MRMVLVHMAVLGCCHALDGVIFLWLVRSVVYADRGTAFVHMPGPVCLCYVKLSLSMRLL